MRASVLKGSGDSASLPQRGQLGQGRGVAHLTRRSDISTLFAELRRKRSNRGICSCATVERCEPGGAGRLRASSGASSNLWQRLDELQCGPRGRGILGQVVPLAKVQLS
mgnify:CR=1 FL=1|jgi:hypothetical protein